MELQANYEEYFHNFANNLMQLLQHNQFIDMYEETYKSLGIENMKPYLDRLEEFRSSKTGFAALRDNLELKVTENVLMHYFLTRIFSTSCIGSLIPTPILLHGTVL